MFVRMGMTQSDFYGSGRKPPADLEVGEYVRVGHGYQRVSHVSKQPGGWVRIALSTSVLIVDGSASVSWMGAGAVEEARDSVDAF